MNTSFNPDAKAVSFHEVEIGQEFRSHVCIPMRAMDKPTWSEYRKISKSKADLLCLHNSNGPVMYRNHTEVINPHQTVFIG